LRRGGRRVVAKQAKLAIKPKDGASLSGIGVAFDGQGVTEFTRDDALGGLPSRLLSGAFANRVNGEHTVTVAGPEGAAGGIDDVLVYVAYQVASANG
jgi:hypothetical protein